MWYYIVAAESYASVTRQRLQYMKYDITIQLRQLVIPLVSTDYIFASLIHICGV